MCSKMIVEEGEIIRADYRILIEEVNPVLEIEIKLDDGLNCCLTFEDSNIIPVLEMCSRNKGVSGLVGERVKLMPHPRGGTSAPIAISKGLLNQWVYKRRLDRDGNKIF